jgi:acetyltransferase-like isoleucine patch superfamily enzyme
LEWQAAVFSGLACFVVSKLSVNLEPDLMAIGIIERAVHSGARLRNKLFTLLFSSQFAEFGTGARISPPFRFYGLNEMSLGEGVMINPDCWLQTIPGHREAGSSKLIIKAHAAIGMGAHISAAKQVIIGEYVILARNVYISDHAHAFENIKIPIIQQGIHGIAPVSIGWGTWLGQNVVVLPGVTIGRHCVIGANSVINSSIPDFSVAVGAPARVVKHYNHQAGKWEKTIAVEKAY